jgi:hypothetical protein
MPKMAKNKAQYYTNRCGAGQAKNKAQHYTNRCGTNMATKQSSATPNNKNNANKCSTGHAEDGQPSGEPDGAAIFPPVVPATQHGVLHCACAVSGIAHVQ